MQRRLLLLCLLAGCTSFGPGDLKAAESAALSTALTYGNPVVYGPTEWYPNSAGPPDFLTALAGGLQCQSGYLVVSDSAIVFMQWRDGRYVIITRIMAGDIHATTAEMRRLVVHKAADLSFDSFGFLPSTSILVDGEREARAVQAIKGKP